MNATIVHLGTMANLVNSTKNITKIVDKSFCLKLKSNEEFILFIVALVFIAIIFITVFGNLMVIIAVWKVKKLQTTSNYLVVSLAVTDLIVGLVVMPIRALRDVFYQGHFKFGPMLCDISSGITLVVTNASVAHLIFIALDRLLSVTNMAYIQSRNTRRIGVMITVSWLYGVMNSVVPLLWRDYEVFKDYVSRGRCFTCRKHAYLLTKNIVSFYIPLAILLVAYMIIFSVAKKSIRNKPGAQAKPARPVVKSSGQSSDFGSSSNDQTMSTTAATNVTSSSSSDGPRKASEPAIVAVRVAFQDSTIARKDPAADEARRREERIAKTLTIVTLCFVLTWLPINSLTLLKEIVGRKRMPQLIIATGIWCFYLNSMMNPIIYTIFNVAFRNAFKQILRIK